MFTHVTLRPKRTGVTLLELMLILFVIAMLYFVSSPRGSPVSGRARSKSTEVTIQVIQQSLLAYKLEVGAFPSTEQGLNALVSRPEGVPADVWDGPYLDSGLVPKDAWGREFVYRFPALGGGEGFELFSLGPDGLENTDDIRAGPPSDPKSGHQ